jgi:MFS transporter, DHA2 family, lincomycin resistance protein
LNTASNASPVNLDLSGIKRGPIVAALIIGAFVSILNETLLNIAFPDLMIEFDVGPATIQWLSTVYMLVIGILVPITALLQSWFTTRQMFLSAMILFLIGTVVCGIAPSFGMLLSGRIIQALGTGLMLPVLMNTILIIYPPDKRGAAMGMIGLVIMFGPAIGPTLSGLIIDSLSWRWLFFIVIPLALFSVLFAAIYLRNVSDITRPRVDVLSIILSSAGFGGIVYGFSKAGELSWSEPEVYWTIIVGVVSVIAFVWRQLVMPQPMLDLRAFRYPMFALVTVLMLVLMMTLFSTMIMLPLFLQSALLMTAFSAGLTLMPGGIVNGIMAPLSGKLFDLFGPRVLVVPGLILVLLGVYLFTGIDADTTAGYIVTLHIILLIGISLIMMPAQTTGLNQLPRSLYAHGTAIMNTLQQVSGAIGTALFITIMSNGTKDYLKTVSDPTSPAETVNGLVAGMQDAFWVAFFIGIGALVLGLFVKRTRPPEEDQPKPADQPA